MYVCSTCATMHCVHCYGNRVIPKDRLCQIMGMAHNKTSELQTSEVASESMLTANNCRETL